jgi:hypothetical protein
MDTWASDERAPRLALGPEHLLQERGDVSLDLDHPCAPSEARPQALAPRTQLDDLPVA